jgi:hypothetical protein
MSLAVAFATVALPAQAQWSTDPSDNLVVADQPDQQALPAMAPTPDGGFYVAWLRDFNQSDVYLQRLDAAGNETLVHNGILAVDRVFSGNGYYAVASDHAGNAVIVAECCDSGAASDHVAVYKFAPDGTPLFGANGITVSSTHPVFGSSIAITSDGDIVALWSDDSGLAAQKLDGSGTALWGANGISIPQPDADTLFSYQGIAASNEGDVLVAWVQDDFSVGSGGARVMAQKLAAADGAPLWGTQPVAVSGPVDSVFSEPSLVSDGAGGAALGWSEFSDPVTFADTVRVQHLDAAGSAQLASGGVEVATTADRTRFFQHVFFDAGNGDIYALWQELEATGSTQGIIAQRIDSAGIRQYGDAGKLVSAFDAVGKDNANLLPAPGGMLAQWSEGNFGDPRFVRVAGLDRQGDFTLPGNVIDIKTAPTNVNTVVAAASSHGYAAYVWTGDDLGEFADDVYAQNVGFDGVLGSAGYLIFANGFDP